MDESLGWYHLAAAGFIAAYHYAKVAVLILIFFVTHPFSMGVKKRGPPSCLVDPRHGVHKYMTVNGVKLHYVEKGDPTKPLMLFVHGFPEFWYSWRYQLQEFSKDYWCIAVDNRGYGDSDKPDGVDSYKVINMVNDLKELITGLGRDRVTIVGHDWGALIVFSFIDVYGDMVDKFVTMSGPSSRAWVKLLWSDWWQFTHAWYVFFFQGPFLPELTFSMNDLASLEKYMTRDGANLPTVTKDDIEAYKYNYSRPGSLTPPTNYYRANFLQQFPLRVTKNMPKGLFLLGSDDEFISKASMPLMEKDYKDTKFVLLPGERHFIQQECPDKVNKEMREFLSQ